MDAAVSALLGAAIGTFSSIATIYIQSKMKDRRDRSKQVTDLSVAQYKILADHASGRYMLPLSAYLHHNDLILRALDEGTYGPQKMREIEKLMDDMVKELMETDRRQRAEAAASASAPASGSASR
jgi:hypothetical protein